jgi:1,6-anhydro-N-acetylmuramate kinase
MRRCSRACSTSRTTTAPPKSTGRDLFSAHWLDARLAGAADVQLVALTARSGDSPAPSATIAGRRRRRQHNRTLLALARTSRRAR